MVEALDEKGMRDNTLILFQADNGGTRNPMFSGEVDTSTLKSLPPDNGPYREGKGTVYEGGTRVVAIANWPGRIKPGTVVNEMIHETDLFPTLIGVAGASAVGGKPIDGLDVWGTISEGKPSPRTEVVYDIQPFRAGLAAGRLEARVADAAAAGGRTLRHRARIRRRRTMSPPPTRTRF